MASVMEVIIDPRARAGYNNRAVLKLYDRRFGTCCRRMLSQPQPHTPASEALLHSFVQDGRLEPFLHEVEEERRQAIIYPPAWEFCEDQPDGDAKFETLMWQECLQYFECETKAYMHLADLQGKSIPRIFGHVKVAMKPSGQYTSDLAPFMEMKGILMERIHGYNLDKLPSSPAASLDHKEWSRVVQTAMDAAHEINRRGIIMDDCDPRNVVVDQRTQRPFIIDLAQYRSRDEMIHEWTSLSEEEDDDEEKNLEVRYWNCANSTNNPGAIGSIMKLIVKRAKGVELDLKWTDYEKIRSSIRNEQDTPVPSAD